MTYDAYIYDKEKVDKYYHDRAFDPARRLFAVYDQSKVIGEIQIKRIDFKKLCGTLSVALVNDAVKGRGFGTEAIRLIIEYAVRDLGLHVIYADAVHRNKRSRHILRSWGFAIYMTMRIWLIMNSR
jgi:RimJ/RimL family protein N-acetyltransferase